MRKANVIAIFKCFILSIFMCSLSACNSAEGKDYTREVINETRLCPEIRYRCLTENKNTEWRKTLLATEFSLFSRDELWLRLATIEKVFAHYNVDKGIDDKGRDAFNQLRDKVLENVEPLRHTSPDNGDAQMTKLALSIAAKFMNKTEEELVSDKYYQLTEREERDIKSRERQRSYVEVAQFMELLYPNFWEETQVEEQIKWVMQAERLGKKFEPGSTGRGTIEVMAGICGIIGIDFEENSTHKPIVDYLSSIAISGNVGQLTQTWDYLAFAYLERDYSFSGRRYSGWALRDALTHLPKPKREVPSLSELPEDKMYDKLSDIWKVYKSTIRNGGTR